MPASSADFINFLARIRKMLGDAPTMSNERKINAQTPNDASTYCRGRGICCPRDSRVRAQSTIDNRQSTIRTGELVVDLKTRRGRRVENRDCRARNECAPAPREENAAMPPHRPAPDPPPLRQDHPSPASPRRARSTLCNAPDRRRPPRALPDKRGPPPASSRGHAGFRL